MKEREERYPPKTGVIKVIVKRKPTHCIDCEFIALRSEADAYPVCCGITAGINRREQNNRNCYEVRGDRFRKEVRGKTRIYKRLPKGSRVKIE